MKKILRIVFIALLSVSLVACGGDSKDETVKDKDDLSVTLIVNGNLGDLGFFDSANEGMKRIEKELGVKISVVETGTSEAKWEPALADAAEEDTDIIIAVSPSMVEPIQKIAPQYPEKTFILIDNTVDFEAGDLDNVYCAVFKQNEGSFLAGALGAYMTTELPDSNDSKVIGFLGGMDIPPINDFLVGYIEGAKYVDEDIKVVPTYAGDYYDPAKGKELGIVLMNQGVDVVFPAAGPTGLGTIEAVTKEGKYIIGVDSDQASMYLSSGDDATANSIVSSMEKKVGNTIVRSIEMYKAGTLPLGKSESLGIKEGGVGLAKNDIYINSLSEETRAKIEELEEKISSGEIKVSSAIGLSNEKLQELIQSVAP